MGSFSQNSKHQFGATAIGLAVMKLSMADCVVVRTTTGKGMTPSVELDRPFTGEPDLPRQIANHGGQQFEYLEVYGCRVYWKIPAQESAA